MKKLAGILWVLVLEGCAIGAQIDDAVEEIEGTLDDLHASECIQACNNVADACWEEANGPCIDTCEDEQDACEEYEDTCYDAADASCAHLDGASYESCLDTAYKGCEQGCDDEAGDCLQACGDEAMTCLTGSGKDGEPEGLAVCTAACVKELEDSLKGIDLR